MDIYTALYAAHLCLFAVCGAVNFSLSTQFLASECPDDAPKANSLDLLRTYCAYTYFLCAALSLIVCALGYYFGSYFLPPELGKVKRVHSILGAASKLAWLSLRAAHLILYALVCAETAMVLTLSDGFQQTIEFEYWRLTVGVMQGCWWL